MYPILRNGGETIDKIDIIDSERRVHMPLARQKLTTSRSKTIGNYIPYCYFSVGGWKFNS